MIICAKFFFLKNVFSPFFWTTILVFLKKKMNELREEIPLVEERFSKVCQMWANIPKSQKDKYTNICNAGIFNYEDELQQWFEVWVCVAL